MNVNKSISDICKDHIDSLTPEEREEEYLSLLERERFWKEYLERQKEAMQKWDTLVSELRSKYFSMVPGDSIVVTIKQR